MSKSSYSFLIFIFLYSCQEVTQTEINKTDNLELKDSISALSSLPESNLSFPPIRINEEGLSDNLTLDELQYDSILAYSFDGFHERTSILKLLQNRRFQYISDYKKLNDRSGNKLIHILSSKSSFGFSTAACFQPSLGILFFKQGRTVYEVNICLDCNSLSSSSPLQAQLYQINKAEKNNKNSFGGGFSKKGQQAIIDFCKEIDFPYGELKQKDLFIQE